MTLKRISALVLLTATALAGCSAHSGTSTHQAKVSAAPSPSTTPSVSPVSEDGQWFKVGEPFRNGPFRITVTSVKLGVPRIGDRQIETGVKPAVPENGQFVLVYMTAVNVGTTPQAMATNNCTLIDGSGKTYGAVFGAEGDGATDRDHNGLDTDQQPGTTHTGWAAFDVPTSVHTVTGVLVQSAFYAGSANPATLVRFS